MSDEEKNALPAFYTKPVVLNAQEHSGQSFVAAANYSFAHSVNCVPIVLGEIPNVLPHYPIVFADGPEPMLVALLGLRNAENLFVDAAGRWQAGAYIPAYVRRYPFILIRLPNGDVALGAEPDPTFLTVGGQPLFADGRPTETANGIYRFCHDFQTAMEETQNFCREVAAAGLLKAKVCTIKRDDGRSIRLTGFSAIEEADLDGLDNHTVNGWRKKHYLKYLYFQIASMARIGQFAGRLEVPPAAPAIDQK
jgi:hypothetical protein